MRRNIPAVPQIDMTAGDNFLAVKQHNTNLNFPGSITVEATSICKGEKKEVLLCVQVRFKQLTSKAETLFVWIQ